MTDGLVIDRVSWHPRIALERVDRGAAAGNRASGEILLEHAQQGVPYDRGTLSQSASLEETGDGEVVVSYGDEVARYVHAHPEWTFQNGRTARWLEDALDATSEIMAETVGEAIHREIGG